MQNAFEYDILIFIGRFQPFHSGHLSVLEQGLRKAGRLMVLCGSAGQPRNTRNPWQVGEIEAMIRLCLTDEQSARVDVLPLMDRLYNDTQWIRLAQEAVRERVGRYFQSGEQPRIGLIGLRHKQGMDYYPKRFPQWHPVAVEKDNGIRGSAIREGLFDQGAEYLKTEVAQYALPPAVRQQLQAWCATDEFQRIREEARFIAKYQQAWAAAPYPPTFVTVDAVVVQSGHVLLVERRAQPGRGLQALPGGFLRGDELIEQACIRELREETRLKVPAPVLQGSIRKRQVFDAPYRSLRGRTITHAFLLELAPGPLPKVKGGDDASKAFWVPLAELKADKLFEDHYFIIQSLIG